MLEHIKGLLEKVSREVRQKAQANAVVAKTISVGERHVIPLCALSLGFGGGGGSGEAPAGDGGGDSGRGTGGGAGGGAKAQPVAVVVVDGGKVRVESLLK
jgi:uncharacterized spore protein YtfJ